MLTIHNHIGGERVPPADGAFLDDIGPATGTVIARIPRSGAADIDQAVAAAVAAQPAWGARSFEDRADVLDAIADAIEARLDTLAALESRDQGKPVSLARRVDIPRAVANFRFFAGAVRHQTLPSFQLGSAFSRTLREPIGVVGLITPWNLPLYLLTWKLAPALAMGNTVVAKPSELTPLTADALAQIFTEVGAPPGLFNLVHGLGPEVGQALVEHAHTKAISFTGGTATGRIVAATAAPMFKKLSLELGGKNPTIVFEDCDLEATLAGTVRAGFANQGEICLCGSRLLVQRSLMDRFVPAYAERVGALRIGDPADPDTEVGALVSEAHRDKVRSYVALAQEEGGRLLCGGTVPELGDPLDGGFFLRPTVVADLEPTCRTATEEIFGPVVTVHPFDTEEEALQIANGVRYGLSASVWTSDLGRTTRMSHGLKAGTVWVNTWLRRDLRVAFGGVKDSGVGREGGQWSLDFFSEAKTVCIES